VILIPVSVNTRNSESEPEREGGRMKRACAIGTLVTMLVVLPVTAMAGVTWKIGDEGEVDLGLSLQALARLTDFRNPNTNDADGGLDMLLRRGLIRLGGNYTDYFKFFLQTEARASTDSDADVSVTDATVNFHYKEIAQLILGLQQPPADRELLTSDDALICIDRPGITGYKLTEGMRSRVEFNTAALRNTNSGLWGPVHDRDIGATVFGTYSYSDTLHFKYYGGIYQGIQKDTNGGDQPRYTARLQMNLFDPEPDYYNLGTYLGAKKTIAIGWSNDVQNNVTRNARNGQGVQYFSANTVDLFVDYPAGPGSATLELALEHT
jgi:hypothetical protein